MHWVHDRPISLIRKRDNVSSFVFPRFLDELKSLVDHGQRAILCFHFASLKVVFLSLSLSPLHFYIEPVRKWINTLSEFYYAVKIRWCFQLIKRHREGQRGGRRVASMHFHWLFRWTLDRSLIIQPDWTSLLCFFFWPRWKIRTLLLYF